MIAKKVILVAAAALFAQLVLGAANDASARDYSGNGAYCLWYKQKAMSTRDEYWWARWRQCMRGWDWK